ncbi:MAG TPA: hypothetical protein VN750_09590 [Steroidobacteraceae bacterium]|nr:hypothetical protein [Steroidobacteraceae bacterium]
MTLHIRGTSTGPIVLGPNSKHLTSIASTGVVSATGIGVNAIDGPRDAAWPIDNEGTIQSASGLGVSLASGGVVSNGSGALISGGIAGILMSGASGTVSNAGAVKGIGVGSTAINTSVISGDGIALLAGGRVSNVAGGSIVGLGAAGHGDASGAGVFITGGAGTVANAGRISGTGYGVALDAGGRVTNTGSIVGGEDGVKIQGAIGTVANSGSIVATLDDGIALFAGGTVTNAAGGRIASGPDIAGAGIFITNAPGAIDNSGAIEGTKFGALLASGSVTNRAGGAISGSTAGVAFNVAAGTVVNAGHITALGSGGAGADLGAGGRVSNAAGGSISGSQFGVFITGGSGTIANAGTLSGGTYAAKFSGGGTNTLLVEPGAVFVGAVGGSTAPGASNTLEFAGGSSAASGVGTGQFLGFQTVAVDAGSTAILNGTNTVPTVLDSGTVEVAGSLDVTTAIDPESAGVFRLDSGSRLDVAAAVGANTTMSFIGPSELAIDNAGAFGSHIGDPLAYAGPSLAEFGAGDVIDLRNFGFAGITLNPLTPSGVLHVANGSQTADLAFQTTSLGAGHFHASSDGGTGTLITVHA